MGSNEELMVETLETAKEYIGKLINGINVCINKLQQGDQQEGFKLLEPIIDGLDWLLNALRLTRSVQVKEIDLTPICVMIKDILEAFENGDNILVSDLLEYEIKPILINWESILRGD